MLPGERRITLKHLMSLYCIDESFVTHSIEWDRWVHKLEFSMSELVNKLLALSFSFPFFPQASIYFHIFFHSRYSFPFIFWSCPALWISTFPFLKSLSLFSADLAFFFWYILKKPSDYYFTTKYHAPNYSRLVSISSLSQEADKQIYLMFWQLLVLHKKKKK